MKLDHVISDQAAMQSGFRVPTVTLRATGGVCPEPADRDRDVVASVGTAASGTTPGLPSAAPPNT